MPNLSAERVPCVREDLKDNAVGHGAVRQRMKMGKRCRVGEPGRFEAVSLWRGV
jgi:hypothetical protein